MDQRKLHQHWQNIWENQESDFRGVAINSLISSMLLTPYGHSIVLDVGCGACGMTLKMVRDGYKVTSIDTSTSMLDMGRHYLSQNGFEYDSVIESTVEEFSISNANKFDQIVCLDVIEHVQDDAGSIEAMLKLLKPGGRIVLTVPAMPSLYGPKDVELGHYRRYTVSTLTKLIPQNCTIKSIRYWNLLGVPVTWAYKTLLKSKVDESIRYGKHSIGKKAMRALLRLWFQNIENKMLPPAGLTLILVAEKNNE